MKISIDTCILLDLLLDQNDGSIKKLRKHRDEHDELIICGMVYGELYPIFEENELNLELFLLEGGIKVEICNNRDYAYAGKKTLDALLSIARKATDSIATELGKDLYLKIKKIIRKLLFFNPLMVFKGFEPS